MIFRFVKNNLFAKPLRNILVTVSCVVSITLMLMMFSIYRQVDKQYSQSNSDYNIVIGAKGSKTELILDAIFFNGVPENTIPYEVYEDIEDEMKTSQSRFREAYPFAFGDNISGHLLVGAIPKYLERYTLSDGKSIGDYDELNPVLVLGNKTASDLGATIGSKFTASHRESLSEDYVEDHSHASFSYTVIGILDKTGTAIDGACFTNIQTVWQVHAHAEEEGLEDEQDHDEHNEGGISAIVALAIGSDYSNVLNNFATNYDNVMTVSIGETLSSVMDLFGSAGGILLAVIVVVIIMSFNMLFLALFTSASERKKEVAILRAIGSNRQRILLTIILESLVIIVFSCIVGLLLSFAGLAIIGGVFSEMMGIVVNPLFMCIEQLYIMLAAIAVALIATIIPALMVYKAEPTKYLR